MNQMEKQQKKRSLNRLIVRKANFWRDRDIDALGHKNDRDKQDAEYAARRALAKTIDDAKEH